MNKLKDIIKLDSHGNNTITESKTIGKIELKFISVKDLEFCTELLTKIEDEREFVSKVLYNQLLYPKINFSEFDKLSNDELIDVTRDFIKNDSSIFKYFKETSKKEFFQNFKEAIIEYNRKYLEEFKSLSGSLLSSQNLLKNFNKNYSNIIKPTLYSIPVTFEKLYETTKLTKKYNSQSLEIAQSLKPLIEQTQSFAKILSEQLAPQIEGIQKWAKDNSKIFTTYNNYWKSFRKEYDIAEQDAVDILRRYKWFISPSMPLSFVFEIVEINREKDRQWKKVNNLFINYYTTDNFQNLITLINSWKSNNLVKPRIGILKDCFFAMKFNNGKYNFSNFVIPTLITQIDGLRIEFMKKHGLSFWNKKWKELFMDQISHEKLTELANDIFINVLFQQSLPGKPLETPYTFNRHKIMHGEDLRYGRIDNTIRAFLIFDFLANLID